VADPQLVDPHTYPGRPWPLSTLTVRFTDLYLSRSFQRIQQDLYPDTIFFLGDLFDGGREWSTRQSESPDKEWRRYGQQFWLKEYQRFSGIFFNHWIEAGSSARPGQQGRKLITSLSGNHDLGFGTGIQKPVRKRFQAYFGDGNGIDVIANHTFVSVDTVSLSAMDQQGADEEIWKPAQEFLDTLQVRRRRAQGREIRRQKGQKPNPPMIHELYDTNRLTTATLPDFVEQQADLPTILLTHVPLFRFPGTPCGPLREHWPPSSSDALKDDRNAISVSRGHQYQNVLTQAVTKDITGKVGNAGFAFSGDDHDYCEVVHRGYPSAGGGIREITVKSLSWAMGVRKPGFVMLSLWNPIDAKGRSLGADPTIQTHLCLMPDQLGIFIRYGTLAGISLLLLVLRAAYLTFHPSRSKFARSADPVLPTVENGKANGSTAHQKDVSASSNSSSLAPSSDHLAVRSASARTRSISPASGYGLGAEYNAPLANVPLIEHAGYYGLDDDSDEDERKPISTARRPRKLTGFGLFWAEFRSGLLRVGVIAFLWFFYLVRHG